MKIREQIANDIDNAWGKAAISYHAFKDSVDKLRATLWESMNSRGHNVITLKGTNICQFNGLKITKVFLMNTEAELYLRYESGTTRPIIILSANEQYILLTSVLNQLYVGY